MLPAVEAGGSRKNACRTPDNGGYSTDEAVLRAVCQPAVESIQMYLIAVLMGGGWVHGGDRRCSPHEVHGGRAILSRLRIYRDALPAAWAFSRFGRSFVMPV